MIGIKLDRPLVVLDTETTGVDKDIDRIVQIAAVLLGEEGEEIRTKRMVNPKAPIPPEATAIHGIKDSDVAHEPTFAEVWPEFAGLLMGADFCAYNAPFDLGMLEAECKRARLAVYKPERVIDPMQIFRSRMPHTLEGALYFYAARDHEGAHDALADCLATLEVLQAQAGHEGGSIDSLIKESVRPPDDRFCDSGRWWYWRFGMPTFAFGKNKGRAINQDVGYLKWMLGQDIPEDTKALAQRALRGESVKREPQQVPA